MSVSLLLCHGMGGLNDLTASQRPSMSDTLEDYFKLSLFI